MIDGVEIKVLKKHADSRGYFMEILRGNDPIFASSKFGQWSESLMYTGVIKAWHLHNIQTDFWHVPVGVLRAVLCDMRGDSATYGKIDEYLMGNARPILIKIPPGVAHGCKVLQGPALLTYFTTRIYNPDDEIRLPYNDPKIGYDWLIEEIK